MASDKLLINEIYPAISGESRFSGRPCTLVRLTGCHVRCSWCDSAHSFGGGALMSITQVLHQVADNGHDLVLVTGGEPLLQRAVGNLMSALLERGYQVMLETSGTRLPANALPLAQVPAGVCRVVDIKPPASGIPEQELDWPGIAALGPHDEIKLVLAGRGDYEWARELVREGRRLPAGVRVAFSPAQGLLPARDLAEWMLADRLPVFLQLQLHKVIWPDVERGV